MHLLHLHQPVMAPLGPMVAPPRPSERGDEHSQDQAVRVRNGAAAGGSATAAPSDTSATKM